MTEEKVQLGLEAVGGAAPSPLWAVAIVALAAGIVLAAGLASDVVKGDEVYYSMFAEAWYDAGLGNRPVYNPRYPSGEAGYYYVTEPLWPFVCSLVWHVTGVHAWSAQALQAGFYALLLAMVYRVGRDVLGPRGALAALLGAVSVPMFGAFSILLYMGVPVTALLMIAFVLLRKKQFLVAGAVMGLAYLMKRNAAFVAPACLAWMLWVPGTFWQRVRRLAVFGLAAGIVVFPDFLWRHEHIPSMYEPVSYVIQRFFKRFSQQVPAEAFVSRAGPSAAAEGVSGGGWWEHLGSCFVLQAGLSRINHVGSWARYGGAVVPILLGLYVARRAWRRGDVRGGRGWGGRRRVGLDLCRLLHGAVPLPVSVGHGGSVHDAGGRPRGGAGGTGAGAMVAQGMGAGAGGGAGVRSPGYDGVVRRGPADPYARPAGRFRVPADPHASGRPHPVSR